MNAAQLISTPIGEILEPPLQSGGRNLLLEKSTGRVELSQHPFGAYDMICGLEKTNTSTRI